MANKDDLISEVEEIFDLRLKLKEIEKEKNKFVVSIQRKMDWLRQAVKRGDTIGDKIKDFVIACCGFPEEIILNFFLNLEEGVRKHPDELFLFVTEEEDDAFNREKLSNSHFIRTVIHLGVIDLANNDGLIFDPIGESWEAPVKNYAVCSSVRVISSKLDEKREFKLNNFEPKSSENRLIIGFPFKDEKHPKPEIRIGHAEVREWFEKHAPDLLQKMIENLNQSVLKSQ